MHPGLHHQRQQAGRLQGRRLTARVGAGYNQGAMVTALGQPIGTG